MLSFLVLSNAIVFFKIHTIKQTIHKFQCDASDVKSRLRHLNLMHNSFSMF